MPRPLKQQRPVQGAHLAALRRAAGLTQAQLANAIAENQQNIARWELSARPPPSPALPKLAKALGVTVEDILSNGKMKQGPQPRPATGRVAKLVDDVANLSRRQQDRFFDFATLFIEQERRRAGQQ